MSDEERSPDDATPLRRLLDPVLDRLEKHSGPSRGPHREAFLDGLIKTGIVPLLPQITAWAQRYEAHQQSAVDGTTEPSVTTSPVASSEDSDPSATGRLGGARFASEQDRARFPKPQDLAALTGDQFVREAALLPRAELERLAAPAPAGEIDPYDTEQRHLLAELLTHNQIAEVFEVEHDPAGISPGDIFEHDGRLVKMLGIGNTEGTIRVTPAPPDARRTPPPERPRVQRMKPRSDLGEYPCEHCDREPLRTPSALKSHMRHAHPHLPVA